MPGTGETLATFRERIRDLSDRFTRQSTRYRAPAYNEETARSEFISPFFEALGWDLANRQGNALQYRDVIHEEGIKVGDATKAPDYTFRIGGQRKFFVEAKKPGVDLKVDTAPAYQLRRYAWSAKLPLSILTDFEELAVYDTRIRPEENDKASVARVLYFRHEEYEPRAEEIWNVFSKRAVLEGRFDTYAEENLKKRGTSEVDGEFLKEIEGWREELAKNLALRNAGLTVDELNYAVQATIDRILFLRIAEGRGAELYGRLLALTNSGEIYRRLTALYREADERYNSGIFDFKADQLTLTLALDDKVIRPILKALYYPESPYEFSVLPAEILGNVYEQFLGKVIRLTPAGRAKVEEKPEVKKAGGVYYTPSYIVDYIVANTVGKLVDGKSPKEMEKLRVVDPACGSGSFLLSAYQKLLDAHLAWYREHEPKKHKEAVFEGPGSDWRLTTAKKREVLLNSVHGVDIDRQAVEVTKLSLLLKCLEGETNESLRQLNLYGERALPSLDKNIQCGNSLISPEALLHHAGGLFPDEDELRRINPFDWHKAFPEVFKSGGFDAVIGNPPYIRIQTMKDWAPLEVELYKGDFRSAASGNYDIYVVFVERGLSLLCPKGVLGFILPHKFFNAKYGEGLRRVISEGEHLSAVVHFGDQQVFTGATTYTCLLFLSASRRDDVEVLNVRDIKPWIHSGLTEDSARIESRDFGPSEWHLAEGKGAGLSARLTREFCASRLGEIATRMFQGCITSADSVFLFKGAMSGPSSLRRVFSKSLDEEVEIESWILKRVVRSREIARYQSTPSALVLFPYELEGTAARLLTTRELRERAPRALRYLEQNRTALEAREAGQFRDSEWYRFGRSQNLGLWEQPKVMIPYMVTRLAAYPDQEGGLYFINVTTGGYGLTLREGWGPLYVTALLNSRLLDFLFKMRSSNFHGGYHPANKQFIENLPIATATPTENCAKARISALETLASQMVELRRKQASLRTTHDRARAVRQAEAVDAEIDRLVYELYELTPEEIAIVEKG